MPKTNKEKRKLKKLQKKEQQRKKEQKQEKREDYVLGRIEKFPDLVDFLKKCDNETYVFYVQTDYDYYYDYGYM